MQNIFSKLFVCFASKRPSTFSFRPYSSKKTLYDVLQLKRNCTDQDIRSAFLKLSKENHPDIKGAAGTGVEHEKFIDILNAYQILSKKESRAQYDIDLDTFDRQSTFGNASSNDGRPNYMRYGDFSPTSDPNPGPYYGVKGFSKVSNMNIAIFLVGIAIVGTLIQFFLIRHSSTLRRDALDEYSKDAGQKHANARAEAEKYGNQKQLERLAEKWIQNNGR